ncbi:MAG: hypothetical protein Q7U04_03280, partial [Bacteriovorax sp.]|nr:hypothetical protein [Bacteriovorax sp.]
MNFLKKILLLSFFIHTTFVFAKGGDDVGNGGFAYKQSVLILKMATTSLAEKEAEVISDESITKNIYATMFITESNIKKYGFSMENGVKIKANQDSMNRKMIYYYWPFDDSKDPMNRGNRKLF